MTRKNIYEEILIEKLGEKYISQVRFIKEGQCCDCKHNKKHECRLVLNNERCINYEI